MPAPIEDALADCLEAIERDAFTSQECLEQYDQYRDELEPLLETVQFIQRVPTITLDRSFRKASHIRLMNQIRARGSQNRGENQSPMETGTRGFFWLNRRPAFRGIIASLLVLLLLAVGVVRASAGALPGDPLFSIKTTMERTQLAFADEETAVEIHLQIARSRLGEMEALAAEGRFDDLVIAEKSYSAHITQAKASARVLADKGEPDPQGLTATMDDALSSHSQRLDSLLQTVPEKAKAGIQRAIEASGREPAESAPSPMQGKPAHTPAKQEKESKTPDVRAPQEEGKGPPASAEQPEEKSKGPPDQGKSKEDNPNETSNEKEPQEGNKPGVPKRSGRPKGNITKQSPNPDGSPQNDPTQQP